jgi:general stress protein 26
MKAGERKISGRVDELRELVRDMATAMMTTRRADGHLVSRPMALQKQAPGADFWFVAARDSGVVDELRADPHVNLAFYKDRTREYVSVSGTAHLTSDRGLIRQLYAPDWKLWFEDQGGAHDGSPDDPRLLLIGVTTESARFLSIEKPQLVVLFEILRGMVTGKSPDLGEEQQVSGRELRGGQGA